MKFKTQFFLLCAILSLITCQSKSSTEIAKEKNEVETLKEPESDLLAEADNNTKTFSPPEEPKISKDTTSSTIYFVNDTLSSSEVTKEIVNNSIPKSPKVQVEKTQKPIKTKGYLQFDQIEYNFGFIEMGESVDHSFAFTNTGKRAINISQATATCGCTTPSYPFLPIEPGETGKIDVRFNSKGRLGNQSATVSVFSDAENSVVKLNLTGVVRSEIVNSLQDSL